jgi:hypothetical protein
MDGADLRVRLRREEREDVVGGLAFLNLADGRPVGPDAGEAGEGALSSSANQMSPLSALLNSLKELNGTTQRFSAASHRVRIARLAPESKTLELDEEPRLTHQNLLVTYCNE